MTDDATSDAERVTPDRRRAMKGLAGVGAAAVIWAEPSIKGLARRPAYAAPATGPSTVTLDINVQINASSGPTVAAMDPFGFGNLDIDTQINPNNGRPRFRLSATQTQAGNENVSFTAAAMDRANRSTVSFLRGTGSAPTPSATLRSAQPG